MNKSRTITVSIAWLALSFFAMPIVRAQDMVKVAPKNCKVLLDNDRVRVIRVQARRSSPQQMVKQKSENSKPVEQFGQMR